MSEIETLKKLISKLERQQKEEYKGKKILGFTLSLQKDGSGRPQWRAYTWYKGKRANVYIGKDAEQAEKKIKVWVTKNLHFLPLVQDNI